MKKHLKVLAVTLYPYIYLIFIVVFYFLFLGDMAETAVNEDGYEQYLNSERIVEAFVTSVSVIFIASNAGALTAAIINTVSCAKGKYTALEAAKINMAVKGFQIPAYLFHFAMGFIGAAMSIWGIGFLMFAIVIDAFTIILSGINAIGCAVRFKRDGILDTTTAVLMAIGSFIYCVDVVLAVVYLKKAKKAAPVITVTEFKEEAVQ